MKLLKIANPVVVTKGAFGLAGSAVGLAGSVARGGAHVVLSGLHQLAPGGQPTGTGHGDAGEACGSNQPPALPVEPHAPEEPPIDVVGRALAADSALGNRATPEGAGLAHEPRGSSRDEEHGSAPLRPAESDAIADEVTAALEGNDQEDLEPDDHLTQPLIDEAESKALAAEMQTLRRAADPHKD